MSGPLSIWTMLVKGYYLSLGPAWGPAGLVACLLLLLLLLLLDAQAPPNWRSNLINGLKYYVLQPGGPNQDWVLGRAEGGGFWMVLVDFDQKNWFWSILAGNTGFYRTIFFWSTLAEKGCFVRF